LGHAGFAAKRESLARHGHVDDPLGWLKKIAAKVLGYDLNIQVIEAFDKPQSLVCTSTAQGKLCLHRFPPQIFAALITTSIIDWYNLRIAARCCHCRAM